MSVDNIIHIVAFVLTVVLFAYGLYKRVRENAVSSVAEFIALAEATGLPGKEKMAIVVSKLSEMVPAPFKPLLNEVVLEEIAQWIFDWMKKYANAYIESKGEKGKDAFDPVNDELATDVVKRLSGLGTVGLKALAVNMGIDVDGKEDSDIIKEIVLLIMDKV